MRLVRANRWSLAFADLSLLMLGFVVLSFVHPRAPEGQSPDSEAPESPKDAVPLESFTWSSASLFEPQEAMLTPAGREKAREVARTMGDRPVGITLSVAGQAGGSARLDQWELAAARMASFARALRAEGVDDAAITFRGQHPERSDEQQSLILTISVQPRQSEPPNGTGLASQNIEPF